MDLSWVSAVTHLLAFGVGVWVGYALVVRTFKVVQHEGHLAVVMRHSEDDDEGDGRAVP